MDRTAEAPVPSLPDWLESLLPEQIQPHVLSTVEENGERILRVTSPAGEFTDFRKLAEVDQARHTGGWDLIIEDDVYEHFSEGRRHGMLTYPSEQDGYVGMLMARSDGKRRASLERAYSEFLEAKQLYDCDPKDFVKAWRFIDCHPAFWTAYDLEKHPWYWETQGYGSKLRQEVYASSKDRLPVVSLEAGGHVPHATSPSGKAYSEHYGDWRLEVRARSFEEAILELAFRVSKAFDAQGNSLDEDSFPYEAPEWINKLRERISDQD